MRSGVTLTIAAACAALMIGCSDPSGPANSADAAVNMEISAPAQAGAAPASPGSPEQAPTVPTGPSLAYVHRYTIETPADRVAGLMARHEQACVSAGPAVCQVIGSSNSDLGGDAVDGRLELRAAPAFVARFRTGVAEQATAAGGRVAEASTESEDLTRALIDTQARLTAQTTLRDRLQQLLATRSGTLQQLLEVERELARVQGEVEAVQSSLEVMRTRVATSRLDVDYRSRGALAPDSAFRPVADAVRGAVTVFMTTVGLLITALAVILPLALVAVPVVWLVVRLRRRRAKPARPSPVAPPKV